VTTNEAETTHAIVEGPEASGKESKQVLHHVSAVNLHKNSQDSGCKGSVCEMKPKTRLTSTSSSTSSQAASHCCQYVSVVVTNENEPCLKHEKNVSQPKDNVNQLSKPKSKCNPSSMEISNENENPVELKHNSNDEDIPSNAKNLSGNQDNVVSDIQMVIIEKSRESDNLSDNNATPPHKQAQIDDDIVHDCAFTDDSCIQYIDA